MKSKPRNKTPMDTKGRFPLRKISVGSDQPGLFLSCIIHIAGPKIFQLFIIRVADHRFKLEQKIGTESSCAGSILFRSGPNPMLEGGRLDFFDHCINA